MFEESKTSGQSQISNICAIQRHRQKDVLYYTRYNIGCHLAKLQNQNNIHVYNTYTPYLYLHTDSGQRFLTTF